MVRDEVVTEAQSLGAVFHRMREAISSKWVEESLDLGTLFLELTAMVCSRGMSLMIFKAMFKSINAFADVAPRVLRAIEIAEEQGLCQRGDLDLKKCRESLLLSGKVLLFNKKGWKVGLIAI